MKRILIGLALAAATALAGGCSDHAVHPACKDEATKSAYVDTFQSEMIAAAKSGKIDAARLSEMQAELIRGLEALTSDDWGGICVKIDDIRKKYGL